MPLTQRLSRAQLQKAVQPKCLRCGEGISLRPRWQTQGYFHNRCQQPSDAIDSPERRKAAHAAYLKRIEDEEVEACVG